MISTVYGIQNLFFIRKCKLAYYWSTHHQEALFFFLRLSPSIVPYLRMCGVAVAILCYHDVLVWSCSTFRLGYGCPHLSVLKPEIWSQRSVVLAFFALGSCDTSLPIISSAKRLHSSAGGGGDVLMPKARATVILAFSFDMLFCQSLMLFSST